MKVPRSPLPRKSLERAGKASEAEGVQGLRRAGERAAPGAKQARAAAAGLPAQGVASTGGGAARSPQVWASPAWPSGSTALSSDRTRGEKGLMLSLNATKVQSYNIWDFSSNANFYKFFFFPFLFFFIFCFLLIFLLLYRYFKLLLFKILYNYYVFKRGKS